MKPILTVLLLFITLSAGAQKIRFSDSTNQWTTLSVNGDGCYFQTSFRYGADTIIHGITYRKLFGNGSQYFGYHDVCYCGLPEFGSQYYYGIREDTIAGLVYYIVSSPGVPDTLEHLLYNYNLNVGDSINYAFGGGSHTDTVVSMDSTPINGIYHKIFNFQNKVLGFHLSYTVLEGVGCTNSPIFPTFFGGCFEYSESLVCFYENGMLPAAHAPINSCAANSPSCTPYFDGNIFDNIMNCGSFLSVKTINKQTTFAIDPNPATDHIDIISDRPFAPNTSISVYDMTGRCILRTPAEQQNSVSINTGAWADGLYMVIIQDNNGILKKEKIVVIK